MIDLYGSRGTEAAQEVTGRAIEAGTQATAGLRTKGASKASFMKALRMKQGTIFDAIEAWGLDTVLNWKENSAQIMQSLQQELKELHHKMAQARARGDMKSYELAMQRVLFDKQMAAQAKMLSSSNTGSIVSAIVGGLGQLAAGYFSEHPVQWGKKLGKPGKEESMGVSWQDYYPPPHGGGF